MSLGRCIPDLVEDGSISGKQAEYVASLYEKLRAKHRGAFADEAADALASEGAVTQLEWDAIHRRRQALKDVARKKSALDAMASYRGRKGKFDMGKAAEALLARDGQDRAPYANVEYRVARRTKQALALMTDVMARHSRNLFGAVRDKSGTIDILRELRGEKTGNLSAAELADAVRAKDDLQLAQFNAAGGRIAKLENRGVAQLYTPQLVAKAGLAQWKADELAHLDTARMIDRETGETMSAQDLDALLDRAFERIRTDSAGERAEGAAGGMMVANRRQEHRVLIYKSADDWLAIAEKYGNANVYDAIMAETYSMARDIGAMEILGPNPAGTVRWLKDVVTNAAKKEAGAGSDAATRAEQSADKLDALWAQVSGANGRGHHNWLALTGSTLRAHQVASKLGSAVVTALPTDMATGALTRAFNGLPTARVGLNYLKYLASKGKREQAARFGFVAEQASAGFSTQARFLGEELTGEFQARLAEGVMRASGLNLVTDVGRMTFREEVLAHISDERGKAWDALHPRFRGMFERYGIHRAGWDALRSTPTEERGGAPWIRSERIDDRELADRLEELILAETDLAVVTAGVRTQAVIAGFGKRGTWQGEIARSLFQFKAFPISILYLHGARMIGQQGWNKAAYSAAFLGMTTVAGYLALQAKEVVKGRDPRPMSVKTMVASMQQGGGFGIYGDFLFASTNRFGKSLSETVLGPSASTVDAVSGLVVGSPILAAEGEEVDFDRQLVKLLRSETPGGSLWYARLGYERLLLDQWQAQADPNASRSWNAAEGRAEDQGQGSWWAPGEMTPERGPDLVNAWEGEVPE